MGGDGTFNEILNGLMLHTQQTAGVNLRRNRFVLVQPNIRLGIIPAGFSNSIAWSILGTKCPRASAAQILLGKLGWTHVTIIDTLSLPLSPSPSLSPISQVVALLLMLVVFLMLDNFFYFLLELSAMVFKQRYQCSVRTLHGWEIVE